MTWGSIELEPEIVEWLEGLPDDEFGRVEFYIDLLADRGSQLGEPYTRQLQGKLRELRFYLGPQSDAVRITYYIHREADHPPHGVPEATSARASRDRPSCSSDGQVHRRRAHNGGRT